MIAIPFVLMILFAFGLMIIPPIVEALPAWFWWFMLVGGGIAVVLAFFVFPKRYAEIERLNQEDKGPDGIDLTPGDPLVGPMWARRKKLPRPKPSEKTKNSTDHDAMW